MVQFDSENQLVMEFKNLVGRATRQVLFEKTEPDKDPMALVEFSLYRFDRKLQLIVDSEGDFDMYYLGEQGNGEAVIKLKRATFQQGKVNQINGTLNLTMKKGVDSDFIDISEISDKYAYTFIVESADDTTFSDILENDPEYADNETYKFRINIRIKKLYDKSFIDKDTMTQFAKDKAKVGKTIDDADAYLSKFGFGTRGRNSKEKEDSEDKETSKGITYKMDIILKGKDIDDYEIRNKTFVFTHNMAKNLGMLTGRNIQVGEDTKYKYDDVRIVFESDDDRIVRGTKHKLKTIYTSFDGKQFSKKLDIYDTIIIEDFEKK